MTASYAIATAARRRQVGLALLAAAVAFVGGQGLFEWLLPYDMQSLQWWERHVMVATPVDPGRLALLWALACEAAIGLVAFGRPGHRIAAGVAAGLLIGSSRVVAGGPVAAIVLQMVGGVASLGWQSRKEGGLGLLLALAASMAAWDAVVAPHPTLWPFCLGLVFTFVWIERRHIQASDRLLFQALAERDGLIGELGANQEQLTRLQHARTQLLASISHDLRQPLQAVRLYADALRSTRSAADSADLVDRQMRAADDAVAMLDQFSDLSAMEQGALRSQPVVVDALEVLTAVADALRATHGGQAIDIRVHGRRLHLWVDRSQFARIVQNLAGNAARYSLGATSAPRARVVLAVRQHGSAAVVDVYDNGPGIPPEQLERVFEPYVQLHRGGGRGGRGLGLTIVRGLVTQIGLRLAPTCSTVGRGTRFRVEVPASLLRKAAGVHVAKPAVDSSWLTGKMFAVLDDEDAPRESLVSALTVAGAHCVQAPTLELLAQRLDNEVRFPDALIFDLELRDRLDGIAAVHHLRERWECQTPALVVTGRVEAERAVVLPQRCAWLAKPLTLATVVQALDAVMGRDKADFPPAA